MSDKKVTYERIQHLLATSTAHYNRLYGTTTVCQIVLQNGFSVAIGESACIDPENFDEKLGRKYAYEKAIKLAEDKLWELEGYLLASELRPIK